MTATKIPVLTNVVVFCLRNQGSRAVTGKKTKKAKRQHCQGSETAEVGTGCHARSPEIFPILSVREVGLAAEPVAAKPTQASRSRAVGKASKRRGTKERPLSAGNLTETERILVQRDELEKVTEQLTILPGSARPLSTIAN